MKYSIVSNSCSASWLYQIYNPGVHPVFVEYTTPFTASWFPDDESYVRFCENYDKYTALDPIFANPINLSWKRDTGSDRHIDPIFDLDYLVMFLGDVEIHWLHERSIPLLLAKYKARLELSKQLELIFIWSEPEMFNIHDNVARKSLVDRFTAIPNKTIFLTKNESEAQNVINSKVHFVKQWSDKSQYDRFNHNFLIRWYDQPQVGWLFKKSIDEEWK
jgi:hypothetical protein